MSIISPPPPQKKKIFPVLHCLNCTFNAYMYICGQYLGVKEKNKKHLILGRRIYSLCEKMVLIFKTNNGRGDIHFAWERGWMSLSFFLIVPNENKTNSNVFSPYILEPYFSSLLVWMHCWWMAHCNHHISLGDGNVTYRECARLHKEHPIAPRIYTPPDKTATQVKHDKMKSAWLTVILEEVVWLKGNPTLIANFSRTEQKNQRISIPVDVQMKSVKKWES